MLLISMVQTPNYHVLINSESDRRHAKFIML